MVPFLGGHQFVDQLGEVEGRVVAAIELGDFHERVVRRCVVGEPRDGDKLDVKRRSGRTWYGLRGGRSTGIVYAAVGIEIGL